METQRVVFVTAPKQESNEPCEKSSEIKTFFTVLLLILLIVAVGCSIIYIWYEFKNRLQARRMRALFTKPIWNQDIDNKLVPITIEKQPYYGNRLTAIPTKIEENINNDDMLVDSKKNGIYTKKESIKEFGWLKKFDGMNFVFPDITKKLKLNDKEKQSYTELTFIKNNKFTKKAKDLFGYFPIPLNQIKKAKIIGFSGSEVVVPISANKPKFILIVPISQGLSVTTEKDQDLDDQTTETREIKEPTLIRTDNITISQFEKSPKQFVLFYLTRFPF